MAEIYRGYNVNFFLNDVINKNTALINIGLNPDDVDVINGISKGDNGLNVNEFRTMSGLTLDAQKELVSIERAGGTIENLLSSSNKIDYLNRVFDLNMQTNLDINDQLRAGAIKYTFLDYADNTIKSADISTSRVSSWSSAESPATNTSPILYGSKVEVSGNVLALSNLETSTAPIPKRYTSEVATDKITLNINGTNQNFYAMRDIPLVFYGSFRNANLSHVVNDIGISGEGGSIRPVWKVSNLNNPNDFVETAKVVPNSNPQVYRSTVGLDSTFRFRDPRGRSLTRKIEFFYHPDFIKELEYPGIQLTDLPLAKLPILELKNIRSNKLVTLPANYGDLTPSLLTLDISLNPFTSVNNTGTINSTLNNFFSKSDGGAMPLQKLTMNTTFTGNEDIDLTLLTDLREFFWSGYTNRYNNRRMSGTVFPRVSQNTIRRYNVGYHGYSRIPHQVNLATNLTRIDIFWTSLSGWREANGTNRNQLTFENSKTTLTEMRFNGGSHQIIDVSDFEALKVYHQRHTGGMGTLTGKFSGGVGLSNLEEVNFYASNVSGNIAGEFANKPSLRTLDLRYTRLGPNGFTDTEFSGSGNLQNIYIYRGAFNTNNFFGNTAGAGSSRCFGGTDLRNFYLIDNGNIRGELPNFGLTRNLRSLWIRNTNLSGTIQGAFSLNTSLAFLQLYSNNFSGQIPGFNSVALRYVRLENNNFSFSLPEQQIRNCYLFYVHNNSITGTIPSFAGCPSIQYLNLSQNQFERYTPTSLSSLTSLRRLDISNCSLGSSQIQDILSDMVANYQARTRRGVQINLLGNGVSETDLSEDGLELLSTVRGFGWTVLL